MDGGEVVFGTLQTYLGEINHKDQSYPGEHEAIIDPALFAAVQAKLDENRNHHLRRYESSDALLLGRLRCGPRRASC